MSKLILRLLVLMTLVLSQRSFSFGDDFLHRSQQGISKIEVTDAAFPETIILHESGPIVVVVKNTGTAQLVITGFKGPNQYEFKTDLSDFQISQDNPVFLGPNKELRFQIWFTPLETKSYLDSIVFDSDADNAKDPVCIITGEGHDYALIVSDAAFPKRLINTPDSIEVSIKNISDRDIYIDHISGPNNPAFSSNFNDLPALPKTPFNLPPEYELKFKVFFLPTEEKIYADSIIFVSNVLGEEDAVCLLNGEGWDDISAPEAGISSFNVRILPNPLDSRGGQIEFENPVDGTVEIILFNSLNRQVAVLQSGWMKAGSHSIRIPAESLPSGAYTFRIVAGNKLSAGSFVIAK